MLLPVELMDYIFIHLTKKDIITLSKVNRYLRYCSTNNDMFERLSKYRFKHISKPKYVSWYRYYLMMISVRKIIHVSTGFYSRNLFTDIAIATIYYFLPSGKILIWELGKIKRYQHDSYIESATDDDIYNILNGYLAYSGKIYEFINSIVETRNKTSVNHVHYSNKPYLTNIEELYRIISKYTEQEINNFGLNDILKELSLYN